VYELTKTVNNKFNLGELAMKAINVFAALSFLFVNNYCFAQEFNPLDFFPSAVGNVWDYDTPGGVVRFEIIKDSVDESGNKFLFYGSTFDPIYLIDTTSKTVIYGPNFLDWFKYKLDSDSGDTWQVRPEGTSVRRREALVTNKYHTTAFGIPSEILEIEYWNLDYGDTVINEFAIYENTEILAAGFGLLYDYTAHGPVYTIRGCIIEQDTFGIVTSVEEDFQSPDEFHLSQNYPNPFNPSTTIRFQIPNYAFVELKVFDLLGREISVLIKEEKPAGIYEVKLNGSDLASGTYIYTIRANDFYSSNKMLILK
jgi:hypothetical protein